MKKKLSKKMFFFLERCYGKNKNDPIHGLPHVERVFEAFKLFKESNAFIGSKDLKSLEYAVFFHDIGRNIGGDLNHGYKSVLLLDKHLRKSNLKLPQKELVFHAIRNHPRTFDFKNKGERNLFLAYLVILDGMDSVGISGTIRTINSCRINNIPYFPKKGKKGKIIRVIKFLDNPQERTDKERKEMKEGSILEHLTYNFSFFWQINNFLEKKVSTSFKKEANNRLLFSKSFIKSLLIYFSNK